MGTRYCPKCESEDIKYAGIVDGNFDLICRCLSCGHRWHQMKGQYIKDDSLKKIIIGDEMEKRLKDFIHNGEPIPAELCNSENGYLLTKIAGEYLDNNDHVRAMIALMESKKCHEI